MNRIAFALTVPALVLACASAAGSRGPAVPADPLPATLEAAALRPTSDHAAIASTVAYTLLTSHYSAALIDDARSKLWLEQFIDRLDPQRLYLLASDVEQMRARWGTRLDDDILAPEPTLEAGFLIYQRYRERVEQRVDAVMAMLAANPPHSDPNASVELDRSEAPWATSPAELDAVWRARVIEQLLAMDLGDERADTPEERLRRRYDRIRRDVVEVDVEDVLEMWLGALTTSFDPHSSWFAPISKEEFDIDMQDTLIGIGAVLASEDGYIRIKELVVGGPAERSGELTAGDTILAVAQGDDEPVDVVEMRIERVVRLIRGQESTVVTLTVQPAGADATNTRQVKITREKVKLAESAASGELHEVKTSGAPTRVGVIEVPAFYVDTDAMRQGGAYGSTANDVAKLLKAWKDKVDVVVIDLRDDGGGSLDQSLELSGLFLDHGPIVQIRDREGRVEVLKDPSPGALYDGPLVVVTNEASASASEIFAAAMQDHGRAIVVGSPTTHGKGTVQNVQSLARQLVRTGHPLAADRSGALKYTTHMFFRVNGDSTQGAGVAADIVLPSPYEGLDILESDLDQHLSWDRIDAVRSKPGRARVDLDALRTASAARVAASPEFGFLREDVAERKAWMEKETLTLDAEARRAERDADKAAEEAREQARKAAGWDGKSDIDPLMDEVLAIAADYVTSLNGNPVPQPGRASTR